MPKKRPASVPVADLVRALGEARVQSITFNLGGEVASVSFYAPKDIEPQGLTPTEQRGLSLGMIQASLRGGGDRDSRETRYAHVGGDPYPDPDGEDPS